MVIFDQLRISDDAKRLYINARVNSADLFAGTTIEQLYICLGSQVYETLNIDPESNGYIYKKVYPEGTREINEVLEITNEELVYNKSDFSRDLFFVYIKCAGVPNDACCYTMVGNYVLGVTFDENLLYQQVMQYTKQLLDNGCEIPVAFSDLILQWNAFKAAIETEHFIPAIEFYNRMFDIAGSGAISVSNTKPCGCHG